MITDNHISFALDLQFNCMRSCHLLIVSNWGKATGQVMGLLLLLFFFLSSNFLILSEAKFLVCLKGGLGLEMRYRYVLYTLCLKGI